MWLPLLSCICATVTLICTSAFREPAPLLHVFNGSEQFLHHSANKNNSKLNVYNMCPSVLLRVLTPFPWMPSQRKGLLPCAEQRGGTWRGKKEEFFLSDNLKTSRGLSFPVGIFSEAKFCYQLKQTQGCDLTNSCRMMGNTQFLLNETNL